MADDEQKVLAAARQLPLAERLAHGNWKVRSEGLDDIKQACSRAFGSQDKVFAEAGERAARPARLAAAAAAYRA